MENGLRTNFFFNFKDIIIDEIALEGLEGIGLNQLWKRIENRISTKLTEKMKKRYWQFIISFKGVLFYKTPEPMPDLEIKDRFSIVHEYSGQLLDPDDYLDGFYEYSPIKNEHGSSIYYNKRELVETNIIQNLSLEEVLSKYGDCFAIVAILEERCKALAGHVPISNLCQLSTAHYCTLELVGKARANGQMTVGNTNLTKIVKDPKHLFYIRKHLQDLGLVRTQCHTQIVQGRGMKSILLRLKRFHQPVLLSSPRVGKLFNLMQYLKEKPDHCEKVDLLIKSGFFNQQQSKRLQKTVNVFNFEERPQAVDDVSKNRRHKVLIKKKYISLEISSEESDHSDDDTNATPLECRYVVGISLLRQAYERFLEAGMKGLTQIELAQILGIEFYTSRTICRALKSKNIVKEFLEDKGRQRTARYIAVAATAEIDSQYAEEKKTLLEYLNTTGVEYEEEEVEVPTKKIKTDEKLDNEIADNGDTDITEVKVIDGLENMSNESLLNAKRNPTLRQLKFANGLLKVVREKRTISGYQTLSTLVSKVTGEPPMDTKALKMFVQRLVRDGQVKMYKIKWPGFNQKYTTLVCDPNLKCNDPVIKAKYKEISLKALTSKKTKIKRTLTEGVSRPLSQFAYPRYMKIQKLHELVISVVYFSNFNIDLPKGFASVLSLVPQMTVGFAVGNISNVAISDISHMKISDNLLDIKLKDAPSDLYERLLQSKSLQNSIRFNLKALAMLGLIQLVAGAALLPSDDYEGNLLSYMFYVNRRAKIVDTTGVWPKQNTDLHKIEKVYYFETFEDVTTYWSDVYNISTNTNVEIVIKRGRKKIKPPVRKVDEVLLYDNGKRYGDGLGPCAFDSSFFMDIPRLWRTFYIRSAKISQQPIRRKKKVKRNKAEIVKTSKLKAIMKKKSPKPSINELSLNRQKKRKQPDSSIKWSKWEDKIIMLCKAAITIMSPTSHPDCLRVRNTVAREILYMQDDKKTASACHRRAAAVESYSTLMHEKECILNEVRRRPDIIQKYDGFLRRLRNRYSANLGRLFKECRLPMLELIWTMCLISRSQSFTQRVPCIAVDLDDFYKNFNITTSSPNKSYNMYKTHTDCEPVLASLKEGIIMTTMLSYEHTINSDTASKIYAIFKKHPEHLLRTALEQLRKSSAISARDKILNIHLHRIQIEDIVQTSYKISALYQRKWLCRLNSEFIELLGDGLEIDIPVDGIKGSPEMNCIFCEQLTCDTIEIISLTTPTITGYSGTILQEEQLNVIDIENKYSLKSGLAGCRIKRNIKKFSELYDGVDVEACLNAINTYSEVDHKSIGEIIQDEIVLHLKQQGEKGCTFQELQAHFTYETKLLYSKLNKLELKNIIKRVGYYENRIILTEFLKYWTLSIEDRNIIPVPWLSLEFEIRLDIFFKWTGVIVNKIFECPGSSLALLSENCEMLSYRAVQDMCMFLEKSECIKLNCIEIPEPDLFSDNLAPRELTDFNKYDSPENILAFPTKNILTKYAYVRKKILDKVNSDVNYI